MRKLSIRLNNIDAKCFARLVLIVALAAFLFRAVRLSDSSFWLDEVLQVEVARLPLSKVWGATHYERVPLDYYLMALALRLGENEFTGRLHAAILGALTVSAAGYWGRFAGGARLAIAAMGLWFALPVAVRFSAEGSQYAMILFAMTYFLAASWGVLRLGRRAHRSNWFHVTLSVALVFWSSILAWLGGAIAGAAFLGMLMVRAAQSTPLFRTSWARTAGCYIGATALGMVLSIPVFWRYAHTPSPGFFAPFDGLDAALILRYLGFATLGYDWMEHAPGAQWALLPLFAFACSGAVLSRRSRPITGFSLACAFVVGAAILGALYHTNHWLEFRYFMPALPFLVMACALGVVGFGCAVDLFLVRGGGTIAGSALLATIVSVSVWYVTTTPFPRPDWRGLLHYIAETSPNTSKVFVANILDVAPVRYYARRNGIRADVISIDQNLSRLREAMGTSHGDWFVHSKIWHWNKMKPEYDRLFAEFPEPHPQMHMAHGRQFHPWDVLLSRAAESGRIPTLGGDEQKVTIRSRREEILRGAGWLVAEGWGDEGMLPVSGDGGRFAAVLESAATLDISVSATAFRPELSPPLALVLHVNGKQFAEVPAVEGSHDYAFTIPAELLRARANIFELRPTRTLVPAELDSSSTDRRALSFWVSKVTIRIKEEAP